MKDIENGFTKKGERQQLRYLTHSARLQETLPSHMARVTIVLISITVFGFIAWTGFTNVNEVARAPGEVVPQGAQQVLQHLEGGIVNEINVEEGKLVNAGDVLMRLTGTGFNEDLGQVEERQLYLSLQQERLKAFIDGRQPDFTKFTTASADQISNQKRMYQSMLEARQGERNIVSEQINQKQSTIKALQSRQATINKNLNITQDLLDRKAQLESKGFVSKISYLETQQEANAMRGESQQIYAQVAEAQGAVKEYKDRLASLDTKYRDEAWRQLEAVENDIAENAKVQDKMKSRVDRLEVTAPVRGLVKSLSVNTTGSVVAPGQTLMEIVPMDRPMVVDVRISPRHIGHLKLGQPVQVKISSFDYSRYGAIAGSLDYISPSTFQSDSGERYYKGRVKLSQNYVGTNPEKNVITPGMTVMTDIVTGDKTILQYLLKPIRNSMQTAMSER
jgi:HlyD family secretion protein/adhesin transport system membrane fusion protein